MTNIVCVKNGVFLASEKIRMLESERKKYGDRRKNCIIGRTAIGLLNGKNRFAFHFEDSLRNTRETKNTDGKFNYLEKKTYFWEKN